MQYTFRWSGSRWFDLNPTAAVAVWHTCFRFPKRYLLKYVRVVFKVFLSSTIYICTCTICIYCTRGFENANCGLTCCLCNILKIFYKSRWVAEKRSDMSRLPRVSCRMYARRTCQYGERTATAVRPFLIFFYQTCQLFFEKNISLVRSDNGDWQVVQMIIIIIPSETPARKYVRYIFMSYLVVKCLYQLII